MQYVLTAEEMQNCEKEAFSNGILPESAMLCAGGKVYEHVKNYNRVLIVAWCGNNGGDGFVCGKMLKENGKKVDIILYGDKSKLSKHAAYFYEFVKDNTVESASGEYDCIVDAVFGIGFHGTLEGKALEAVKLINSYKGRAKIVSVDIPSGLNATTGEADFSVDADETVTFGGYKQGHFIGKGQDKCGNIHVCDININVNGNLLSPDETDIKKLLPKIKKTAHKGTMGHVGIIAGSFGMEGAGALAGISALRSSAGKVSISVPRECVDFYKNRDPELMVAVRENVCDFMKDKDVILFGPGIGRNPKEEKLLDEILENSVSPTVIDADGLYYLTKEKLKKVSVPVTVTPHIGEAARLFGVPIKELVKDPLKYAEEFHRETGATVLLKSNYNIVCAGKNYISCFGCAGMATAGSGDVLAGIVSGCMLLTHNSESACLLASFVHGFAGKCASAEKTEYSVTASDISGNIYKGFLKLTE